MNKVNKSTYNAVDKIIRECEIIEKSSSKGNEDYEKLANLILDSFFKGSDIKETMDSALDEKGRTDGAYQYCIGMLIKNAHSRTPEYKGRDKRNEKIEDFISKSYSKMNLNVVV
jgi:hypothetical protein